MLKDFRDFVNRGNVIDLAVAVVIGAAFGAVTKTLVDHVVTPPLGLLTGGIDFSDLGVVLRGDYDSVQAAVAAGAPVIRYGEFLEAVLNFLVVALAMFLVVRGYNRLRERFAEQDETTPGPPPAPSRQEVLLAEIRDLLKEGAAGAGTEGGAPGR